MVERRVSAFIEEGCRIMVERRVSAFIEEGCRIMVESQDYFIATFKMESLPHITIALSASFSLLLLPHFLL